MMELKPGVWEDKTKQMENERWIGDGKKTGDVDRRTPPEQGGRPTSAEVVTVTRNHTVAYSLKILCAIIQTHYLLSIRHVQKLFSCQ